MSTDARTSEQKLCDAKRMADGKVCGKPAKYRQVWDHPELFPVEHLCGQHARRRRVQPL